MSSYLRLYEGGAFPPLDEASLSLQVHRTLALAIVQPTDGDTEREVEGARVRLRIVLFNGLRSSAFTCSTWSDVSEGQTYVVDAGNDGAESESSAGVNHFVLGFRQGQLECLARDVEFLDRTVCCDGILTALRREIEARRAPTREELLADRGLTPSPA